MSRMTDPGFRSVAVLGAGLMGHALALVHALGGLAVRLQDSSPEALARAPGLIDAALATLAEAGEVDAATAEAAKARIAPTPDAAAAVAGADLVVEAVVEDPAVKRAVFAAVDAAARPDAVIASNTSYLDVFPLMPARRAANSAIAHWYTPPYIVDLVDLCAGPGTAPATLDRLAALYAGFGKRPVRMKKFIPGYVANRIQAAISLEVNRLLDEGYADPQDVDDAVRHGLALRIPVLGHLMKADFTGLEMTRRALANATYRPPEPRGGSETLDRLLAAGRTGVASGAGYFDYGGRAPAELFRERDRRLLALKRHLREAGEISASAPSGTRR
jgi:3-hydroxybutyryl-CoA dehydrogenase